MKRNRRWSYALASLALAGGSAWGQTGVTLSPSMLPPGTSPAAIAAVSPAPADAPATLSGGPVGSADGAMISGLDYPGRTDIERDAPNDPVNYLFPQDGRYRVRGWIDGGFIYNTGNPASKFNGPYNSVDRTQEAMGNQAYLINELVLPQDGSFGFGARMDLLYGLDYNVAQSLGWEVNRNATPRWNSSQYYGLAMPQLYGQVGTNDLNVKLGHFCTIVGYEGVMAPENFFYSKSYSYQFGGPFTQWGGLATAKLTDRLETQVGLVNGWNAIENTTNRLNVLAGVKYTQDAYWTSFAIITGGEYNNAADLPDIAPQSSNRTRYSWLLGLKPTSNFEYIFHHWLGLQADGAPGGGTAYWYGIDQYGYYRISQQWRLGGRIEWFRDEDGTRIGLDRRSNPNKPPYIGNAFSLSGGINYLPTPNIILRPEIRCDWFNGNRDPYQDGNSDHQLMLGFDAIFRF